MAIDPDIQPHLDALADRIVRVEARATQAEQDLAIIEPSIAQLEQTVAALEQTPGTPGGIKNPAIIVAAANSPQAIKARADIVCKPCPHCNDEGVVCTLDGEIIGPCDCTSDDLLTEARRLLDAAGPAPWAFNEDSWEVTRDDGNVVVCDVQDAWNETAHLIAAAPRLIAALLERAERAEAADRSPFCTKQEYVRALDQRDAERAGRERAEAGARQLREAIEIQAERPIPTLPSRWTEDEKVSYRSGWLDRTEHMRDALSFWDAPDAVAEGTEDR